MFCNHVDKKLQIGFITQQKANQFLEEGDISSTELSHFYNGVRAFFEEVVAYSLKSLPLNDQLLQAATFVSFENRATADAMQAEYFVNR